MDAPSPSQTPPYAVVVVRTPLQRQVAPTREAPEVDDPDHLAPTFHYDIPPALRGRLQIGHLVWVPFGPQQRQGVIVGYDERAPVEKTRPIARLADPDPVLSPEHLRLARWMSDHYLAPLHACIEAMLPPGVTQDVDTVYALAPGAQPENPTEAQRGLLMLLAEMGELNARQIAARLHRRNARALAEQLVRRGWAVKRSAPRPPKVRPKREEVVALRPDLEDDIPLRGAKQRRALAYLCSRREGGDPWMPLARAAEEAGVSAAVLRNLVNKGLVLSERRQVWRDPLAGRAFVPASPPPLTSEQEAVWREIAADLAQPAGKPFLLQGVTGSGKTEIYMRAAQSVLARGGGAIILVPEIALTPQTVRRFGSRFPSLLAVMHSRLSDGERYDQWRRLRRGELRLVVGSRSAIFAPVHDLGLIVLDEEHEWSYKQDRTPRYHAREAAVKLARLTGATCILGSATPALESAYRAERGEYVRLRMPQRIMGHRRVLEEQSARLPRRQERYQPIAGSAADALYAELPPVEVVDMRAELRADNRSIFSRALQRAITVSLGAGEQTILFLNHRGSATFVMCRDCGYTVRCPRCDVPLTYHSAVDDLICHHCNHTTFLPQQCPSCWSGRIRFFGTGTQKVEALVRERYPQARVIRWDLDTTSGRDAHERILDCFISGEADVMVGTQMIAKGLDLPKVTLVGVISADTALNLPDYRAGERTFQLLTQVAGRAGRSPLGGRVIVQTYTPHHPAVRAAQRHDYEAFYRGEIAFRREHRYPPLTRLVRLLYVHGGLDAARTEAERLQGELAHRIARLGLPELDVIGPAPAFYARLRGKYRWQLLVRGRDPGELLREISLPLGWRVDVDPESLL